MYCDELYGTCQFQHAAVDAGALLYDDAWVICTEGTAAIAALISASARRWTPRNDAVCCVSCSGQDGRCYLIIHNRGDADCARALSLPWNELRPLSTIGGVTIAHDGRGTCTISTAARAAGVFCCG